ncbi:hypothetical protein SDC9_187697 [bioreactor metagenome]|uniref:Uncharacterized protein n=1 Tax=bioreactor metagenome TaxID=1076179 RepID=A0A645HM86_9ZZZZ
MITAESSALFSSALITLFFGLAFLADFALTFATDIVISSILMIVAFCGGASPQNTFRLLLYCPAVTFQVAVQYLSGIRLEIPDPFNQLLMFVTHN